MIEIVSDKTPVEAFVFVLHILNSYDVCFGIPWCLLVATRVYGRLIRVRHNGRIVIQARWMASVDI